MFANLITIAEYLVFIYNRLITIDSSGKLTKFRKNFCKYKDAFSDMQLYYMKCKKKYSTFSSKSILTIIAQNSPSPRAGRMQFAQIYRAFLASF